MNKSSSAGLLDQLVQLKNQIGVRESMRILSLLKQLDRRKLNDVESVIRLHEVLLFLRAYPQTSAILSETESQLSRFSLRIKRLLDQQIDISDMEHPELSGVSGTFVTDTFTYDIVQWLHHRHSSEIELSWDWFENENRLAEIWPELLPLLAEDAFVEANVPYVEWLRLTAGSGKELSWLLKQFEKLNVTTEQKSELYNAQQLYVTWTPSYQASRTGLRSSRNKFFYHRSPLIKRRDVRLTEEVLGPPPRFETLSPKEGARALDMAREASTVRYRELYGFTHGDPENVLKVDLGRGVDLFIMGLPAERRLPLRAYQAAMIFKNGVAIGYFEGLSVFERMESGFNLYYTFRDGESAWLFARILNVMRHLLGVTVFSLDPYQLGHENEEGIQSGAFWFYRKLGFRSTNLSLQQLTEKEEEKIQARINYRTPASTLRKLVAAPMVLYVDETRGTKWDQFQIRKVMMTAQRELKRKFDGHVYMMRRSATSSFRKVLQVSKSVPERHLKAFSDFAFLLLSLKDEINKWDVIEKQKLWEIIKAKSGKDETRYLRLMQKFPTLRAAFIKLGSRK